MIRGEMNLSEYIITNRYHTDYITRWKTPGKKINDNKFQKWAAAYNY